MAQRGRLLGALGIVFGDIGTSPIYTLRESFKAAGADHDATVALGVLSLVIWTIMVIVTLKYVILVMRADNGGEGGIMALLATVLPGVGDPGTHRLVLGLGILGAALFYGDGMITPAISVLSAVEGLKVATPAVTPYIMPIVLAILVLLFLAQSRGSDRIGVAFGPVMLLWFAVLAITGLVQVLRHPAILAAIDPLLAARYVGVAPGHAFVTLGSVFLAVTGAEALYADMGHFGRSPIRLDWLTLVLPALVLNYAGQAALVLQHPAALADPFFAMVPGWALIPLVLLATAATVIASQAVISGAFSLTQQAMQLGLLPRLDVRQTSATTQGQVYVPQVNWVLLVMVVLLVLAFRSSDNLAAAYGIAVAGTMVVTTILLAIAMRQHWHWPAYAVALTAGPLLLVDLVFFAANALKIPDGGWVPLLIGAVMFTLMSSWRSGRRLISARIDRENLSLDEFARRARDYARVPGTGVYLTTRNDTVPTALAEMLKHVGAVHETLLLLTVVTEHVPYVAEAARAVRQELAPGLARVTLHFGFAEAPDIPRTLAAHRELAAVPEEANYFTGRELPVAGGAPGMARWRIRLCSFLARNAISASRYFHIPPGTAMEVGARVEV